MSYSEFLCGVLTRLAAAAQSQNRAAARVLEKIGFERVQSRPALLADGLDAATGDELWSFAAGGPISGSPTVLAGRVYFSTLDRQTFALDAHTGRRLWSYPDGKYSPLVADRTRVYLIGYARIYGLQGRP